MHKNGYAPIAIYKFKKKSINHSEGMEKIQITQRV